AASLMVGGDGQLQNVKVCAVLYGGDQETDRLIRFVHGDPGQALRDGARMSLRAGGAGVGQPGQIGQGAEQRRRRPLHRLQTVDVRSARRADWDQWASQPLAGMGFRSSRANSLASSSSSGFGVVSSLPPTKMELA